MDLRDQPEDDAFRQEVRCWLVDHVIGDYAALGGRGGSGDETYGFDVRARWERELAAGAGRASAGPSNTAGAAHRSPSR